jgi:hypothetical protein
LINTTTVNPISIAGMIQGYLDDAGQVQNYAGGGTAVYAIDYENGVFVFTAGASLAGSGGVVTTATTLVSYTYATNYDDFNVSLLAVSNGLTVEEQLNSLLGQIDKTSALMGSAPRFSAPDLCLGSLTASTFITRAPIFAPLFAPAGTALYPTPDCYAQRNGVYMARHNTPWIGGDRRLLLTKRGSTKYAVDTPFQIEGPLQAYDQATAAPVGAKYWIGQENSVIATPQVTNKAGTVLNPKSRTIRLL